MDLRHLRYFVAVAQAGSFRKAAEQLHIAQPALTRQITALETDLGVPLFEKGSRRRVLGPAGKAFLEEAHAILASVENSVRRVREMGRKERTKLRFAFTEVASGDAMLGSFVARLHEAMPHTEIEMLPMPSTQQTQALLKGQIDAGCLCCLPEMDVRIAVRPLTDHSMMAVLQRTHPLARRQKLFLKDLKETRLIFVSRTVALDLHRSVVDSFKKAGLPVPILEEVESTSRVTNLVSVGMGVGLLISAARTQLPDGLVGRPIADLPIKYRLAIVWCPESRNPAVAELSAIAGAVESSPQ
jgi:DNA-binding transcriptional LysR family regulator